MSIISDQLEAKIDRRNLLQKGAFAGASLFSGAFLAGCGGNNDHKSSGSANAELDTLNFALNLEYLEAEYYLRATGLGTGTGGGIPDTQIDGLGVQGAVTGGTAVQFSSPAVAQYAREIAVDELNHVEFLRTALGASNRVARPAINFTATFAALGSLIGVPDFDPFANDLNFLLGSFVFEDVGVTAYHGAAGSLANNLTYLSSAAGILAVEAYHSGIIRTLIAQAGQTAINLSNAISNQRDLFAGGEADQGVGDVVGDNLSGVATGNTLNLVPADGNSIAFSRTATQVLNIVYASPTTTPGGFFPNGINTRTTRASA